MPSAEELVCHGQGERVEAQAPLWALTGWDGADTPCRWGEAEGTLCLWVFPSCSSSCYCCAVLSKQLSLSRQDRGMMLLGRQRTAIYKEFCWQVPRLGRKTAKRGI